MNQREIDEMRRQKIINSRENCTCSLEQKVFKFFKCNIKILYNIKFIFLQAIVDSIIFNVEYWVKEFDRGAKLNPTLGFLLEHEANKVCRKVRTKFNQYICEEMISLWETAYKPKDPYEKYFKLKYFQIQYIFDRN